MSLISVNSLKNGTAIMLKSEPWVVVQFQHVNPGKGGAFMKVRLKNLKSGKTLDQTFKSTESVEEADVYRTFAQFLYSQDDMSFFMDNATFEQYPINTEMLGGKEKFLKEGALCSVMILDGIPFSAELPKKVDLRIVETMPNEKGDSASGATKPATLETGAVIQVPLYLPEGAMIKVNTETESYVERVN